MISATLQFFLTFQANHHQLLEEALVEQHNDHETDIEKLTNERNHERDGFDAERLAHEAEVQSLNDQLNLERQEFKSKNEEATSKIKDLEQSLGTERQQAKVSFCLVLL